MGEQGSSLKSSKKLVEHMHSMKHVIGDDNDDGDVYDDEDELFDSNDVEHKCKEGDNKENAPGSSVSSNHNILSNVEG